jgi:hypothetical protein
MGHDEVGSYFTFGKHLWKYAKWVALVEPTYLTWILKNDFPDSVKAACQEAIQWAQSGSKTWSGPERSERAAQSASDKAMRDINRIWKDRGE